VQKRFCLLWIVVALLGVVSCQTPVDRWLADHLSDREKSGILVDKALDAFQKAQDSNDLVSIPGIKATLQLADSLDPTNPQIVETQKKVEAYLNRRVAESQNKVKALSDKGSLTYKEKYTLVVLVQQLQVLSPPGVDLSKLGTQTAAVRAEVVAAETKAVAEAAKTEAAAGKALANEYKAIASLRQVDPRNSDADAASSQLTKELATRAQAYLDAAKKASAAKDYPAADRALDKIDQVLAGAGYQTTSETDSLRYTLSLDWARALLADKKFGEAAGRVNDALAVQVTSEALELREKIAQVSSVRDWDAEYDALEAQLDALIKAGDLKGAWNLQNETGPRLKKDDTKTRLAVRRNQILDAVHARYDSALASYNDEDYGDAKAGFDVVAAVDPGYKLTRAYQDKARARLQLLEGK